MKKKLTITKLSMLKQLKILIVENESLIVDALKSALIEVSERSTQFDFKLVVVKRSEDALLEIDRAITGIKFDFALLNIDIPTMNLDKPIHPEDIGSKLKKHFPEIKLIVLASRCHNYKVNTILNSMNPDGFLIKSDIDFNELVLAIERVLIQPPYYSGGVLRLIRSRLSNNISVDKIDLSILYYLSKGVRTKNLSEHVCLSTSGIERRKRSLRELFDVDRGDDMLLLERAKNVGLI